jgi:S1-C subfamily serine protease
VGCHSPAGRSHRRAARRGGNTDRVVGIYQNVNRAVVNITTRGIASDDFGLSEAREGTGSGSMLDKQGNIVTNFHVVEGARQMMVTLFDGSVHEARLIGTDPNNDLAVVRIDAPADKLIPITWGDSNRLLVGMRVYAIGNPFGLDRTLTTGIVSSLNRTMRTENHRLIRGVIQTDAAINPGNSGGPLLNRQGQMIGITTAIIGRAGQSAGIGLAIPANNARRVVEELIKNGRIDHGDAGIVSVYQTDDGLQISKLDPDGPATKAGLRGPEVGRIRRGGMIFERPDRSKADLITAIDGQPVRTLDDLLSAIDNKHAGEKVTFHIVRAGKEMDVTVELAESSD